jgi:hypothetical protein
MKLSQIQSLNILILFFQEAKQQGKISIGNGLTAFDLNDLIEKVTAENKKITNTRNELIKAHGGEVVQEPIEGTALIREVFQFVKPDAKPEEIEKAQENLKAFSEAFNAMLEKEVEITLPTFTRESFTHCTGDFLVDFISDLKANGLVK